MTTTQHAYEVKDATGTFVEGTVEAASEAAVVEKLSSMGYGAVDGMLTKIAEFYDQEVEATTESLTPLIKPLTIAFLGAVVGDR